MENFIRLYDNVVSPQLCQDVISRFEEDKQGQSPSMTNSGLEDTVRKSTFIPLTLRSKVMPLHWGYADDAISDCIGKVWDMYYRDMDFHTFVSPDIRDENYEIHRYGAGDGHYNLHIDSGTLSTAHRFLSMLVYLNDIEKGGETCFPNWDVEVSPKQGSVAVFPSAFTHRHSANPPVKDYKYVIPAFITHGGN